MYPTLTLPAVQEVFPFVDPKHYTDEVDRAYNVHCTGLVKAFAAAHGTIRTHYPFDAPDGSTDDTVTLDADGNVVVLDEGAPL